MSFVVRPSRPSDLDAIYEMAKLTGGGFTNLPADRAALTRRLDASARAFAREDDAPGDDCYLLILENLETRRIAGSCQIFGEVGRRWPFYSYRLGTLTQFSKELARTFRAEMLTLTTDYEGATEVGGLFLHPRERAGGLGLLLARSRYLFIRQHRARFADLVLAELRGVIDEAGGSPFWDGLAGRFFGMAFQEADEFNAINGHQFIADLMPKHPIYTAMLTDAARAVIGLPHPTGRAAMKMLENEGFRHEGYVDIFDGGPTMAARTDNIRTVRDARLDPVAAIGGAEGRRAIAATGRLATFRAAYCSVDDPGALTIDAEGAAALGVKEGDEVLHVGR